MTDQMSAWESVMVMVVWAMQDFPLFWPLLLLVGVAVRRRLRGRGWWSRGLLVLGVLGSLPWLYFGVPALVH